jgi:hypothetical protein
MFRKILAFGLRHIEDLRQYGSGLKPDR